MQIAIIGTGFVGVITAAIFAKFGNTVKALDVDENKIKVLKKGKLPFFEPNLEQLVRELIENKSLNFTAGYQEAIRNSEVIFICVGTPSDKDGRADLGYVYSAVDSLAKYLQKNAIIVIKSTVPPSTNEKVEEIIKKQTKVPFFTASVPEFLKEGSALNDALHPERVIIGSTNKFVIATLKDLHKPFTKNIVVMSPESAQITKYASNAYLATRIAFINEIANLCEKTGADIDEVIMGLGADTRIGSHYWYPGPGYGGSCFPKDVKELSAIAEGVGEADGLFLKIDRLNEARIQKLVNRYESAARGFKGKMIAVLGLSFKPNTNDMREAPGVKFIPMLIKRGAKITAYDPKASEQAKLLFKDKIDYAKDAYQAAKGADIILLLVEWDDFKQLNLTRLRKVMKGNLFIDTRNIYDPGKMKKYGFNYLGIGK